MSAAIVSPVGAMRIRREHDPTARAIGEPPTPTHGVWTPRHGRRAVKQVQLGQAEQPHQQPRSRHLRVAAALGEHGNAARVPSRANTLIAMCSEVTRRG